MKTPDWVVVVAVCMMLFGGCGTYNNSSVLMMPSILEMQKEMIGTISETIEEGSGLQGADGEADSLALASEDIEEVFENFTNIFEVSEFTKKWTRIFGIIGIFISVFYMLAGVFMLLRKQFSLKLAISALAISMLFALIRGLVLTSDGSGGFMAIASSISGIFGFVIDLILLIIILAVDKTDYNAMLEWVKNKN